MQYELQDLLRVRDHRKDRAQEALLKAKQALEEALKHIQLCQEKLDAFIQKKPEFIDVIYTKVMQKVQFKRNYMDVINLKVNKLEEHQLKLAIDLEKAHNHYKEAQQKVTEASEALNQAMLEKDKIEEHKKIWKEEVRILDEREQDKELEDFKSKEKDGSG